MGDHRKSREITTMSQQAVAPGGATKADDQGTGDIIPVLGTMQPPAPFELPATLCWPICSQSAATCHAASTRAEPDPQGHEGAALVCKVEARRSTD